MALKISLALFFLRFICGPWQKRTIYTTIIITTVFGTAYLLYATFQCGAPHGLSFWERKLLGKCAGTASILGMAYTHGVLTALTDAVFLVLTIPAIIKIKIRSGERLVLGGILTLATLWVLCLRVNWTDVLVVVWLPLRVCLGFLG